MERGILITSYTSLKEPFVCKNRQSFNHTLANKRGSRRRTWQFTASNKEKARALELSPLDLPFTYKGLMKKPTHGLKQEKLPLMGPQRIGGITLKGQGSPPGTTARDIKVETDHGYDTNDCRQLRSQIEEAVKSGQLSHLVKGIKKERAKTSDNQRGEKKEKSTTPAEAPILMINQEESCTRNSIPKSPTFEGKEITFPLVMKGSNSSVPVIIKAKIFGREVERVHMDSGSSYEVIYEHCFLKLKPSIQASKVNSQVQLVGFSGEKSWAIGEVLLEITIGDAPVSRSETLNFVIVRSNSPYNMLLGRTVMQKIGMVVSTIHEAVKFHTTQGIRIMFSTHESDKIVEGIPRTIMVDGKPFNTEHKLNEYSHIKPIKQKRRSLGPDRSITTRKEVEELTRAGILRETVHQTWVANPVMIDSKVESLLGFRLKCFLDAYKGYHQIQMAEEDEDKTSFFAGEGVYCYRKMPFGLKNTRAKYQRLVDKVFNDQIGRNIEAYIDDMVIKSTSEEDMLKDIKETFQRFRSINMKLNPKKCSFRVEEDPFLGHLITKQGIQANPSKVKAIADTEQPKMLKDIQSLNGKLAAL
ncbi:reverse transcriptase domain-containing protein, partial [Tanacetum coccineum]